MGTECITTGEQLTAGGEVVKINCIVCDKKTEHRVGYGGMKCLECEVYMYDFDDFTEVLPKLMKKYNIETKRELGEILGMKKKQVYKFRDSYLGILLYEKYSQKDGGQA